jgi:hypothetical protein
MLTPYSVYRPPPWRSAWFRSNTQSSRKDSKCHRPPPSVTVAVFSSKRHPVMTVSCWAMNAPPPRGADPFRNTQFVNRGLPWPMYTKPPSTGCVPFWNVMPLMEGAPVVALVKTQRP